MAKDNHSNGEIFEDKYRKLETVINQKFKDVDKSPIYYLSHKPGFEEYSHRLECCREVRNVISHYPKERGAFPIEPSDEMIHFLDEMIYKLSHRAKCRNLGIPYKKMYVRSMGDSISETIKVMRDKTFTHVPIVCGRKVIGIFDENALFCYVADNGIVDLENLVFEDIKNYIDLENREMEVFTFHSKLTFLDELQAEFQKQFDQGKRLGVAFITETGSPNEDVTHMLTAWDVIGMDKAVE